VSSGGFRGALAAWLGLIALQAVGTTPGGGGRIASFFGDVNTMVERVLNPNVAAIPDRRAGAANASDAAATAALAATYTTSGLYVGPAAPPPINGHPRPS
jgi:hypothetical protein